MIRRDDHDSPIRNTVQMANRSTLLRAHALGLQALVVIGALTASVACTSRQAPSEHQSTTQQAESTTPYITPGVGSFTDSSGNVYTIDSSGNADENGAPIPGGSGTSAMAYYNGTVYGQDATSSQWYTWDQTNWNGPVAAPLTSSGSPGATPYITPGMGSFKDSSGNVYSIDASGNADENGAPIPGGGGTSAMAYYDGTVYGQDATSAQWYTWDQTTWNGPVAAPPVGSDSGAPPPPPDPCQNVTCGGGDTCTSANGTATCGCNLSAEAADGTTVPPACGIQDSQGMHWTLVGNQIAKGGAVDPVTADVILLLYVDHTLWQETSRLDAQGKNDWWSWASGQWQGPVEDPRSSPCSGPTCGNPSNGNFHVSNGTILDSNNNPFTAKGVNILDSDLGNVPVSLIRTLMPQVNFVRLACGFGNGFSDAQPNSVLSSWINSATAAGIVVMIDSHVADQRPGSAIDLGGEAAWYASLASLFANNPGVWFESGNELNYPVSAEHQNVYDAVRGAGNGNVVVLCVPTGGGSTQTGDNAPDHPSVYASMTDIVWDHHWYNWMTNGDASQGDVDNLLSSTIANYQSYATSQSGTIPVIMGESGFLDLTGVCGGSSVDANGGCGTNQIILSVETTGTTSGSGYGIWLWAGTYLFGNAATDMVDQGNNTLTSHGQFLVEHM